MRMSLAPNARWPGAKSVFRWTRGGGLVWLILIGSAQLSGCAGLWLSWQQPRRTWMNFPAPCVKEDLELFASATNVHLGNGKTAHFWTCRWIGPVALQHEFPALFQHSRRRNRTVHDALANDTWVCNLWHGNTAEIAHQFLQMWRKIQGAGIVLSSNEDRISWVSTRGVGSSSAKAA